MWKRGERFFIKEDTKPDKGTKQVKDRVKKVKEGFNK